MMAPAGTWYILQTMFFYTCVCMRTCERVRGNVRVHVCVCVCVNVCGLLSTAPSEENIFT